MWYFDLKNTDYKYDYSAMAEWLNRAENDEALKFLHGWGKKDFFFFLYFILDIRPVNHEWLVPRIYEFQESYNDTLNLWAREHYKSTIMTFGFPLWKIINNPEITIGIFSNTASLAKDFLRRIKLYCR